MTIVDEKLFDVVYVIESSIANGTHYESLKNNYLLPSVKYFNGGSQPMETDWLGAENNATQFCLLLFNNKSKFACNVTNEGVTRNPYKFSSQLNNLKLTNGSLSDHSHLGEGLAVSLQVFDNLAKQRGPSHPNVLKHCIVVGHLPPLTIPVLTNGPYNGYTFDKILDTFNKKSICLSVISGRIVNQFKDLIKKTSPHEALTILSKSSQYAVDPKHMVFLKGFYLPDVSVEMSPSKTENHHLRSENTLRSENPSLTRKMTEPDSPVVKPKIKKSEDTPPVKPNLPTSMQPSPKQSLPTYQPPYSMTVTKSPKNSQAVQSQAQQPPNNYFPNQPMAQDILKGFANVNKSAQQPNIHSNMHEMTSGQFPMPPQPAPKPQPEQQQTLPERKLAWTGQLQWQETTVSGNEPGKSISRNLPCHATIAATDTLKTDVWPSTLHMQLIPLSYLNTLNRFLKNAKTVTFQFSTSDSDVLQAMYRVMNGGGGAAGTTTGSGQKFAGCVILNPPNPPNPNHVRVLLLLYHNRKKTFMGVIPDEQQTFVNELIIIIISADKNGAKHQQNLTGQQQARPTRPVVPVMNPQIPSTNQAINASQISTPQIIGRQIQATQNPSLRSLLTTNNIQQQLQQQQQQQVTLQQQQHQQVTLQQQLQPQPLQQVRPQPVNPLNWGILQQQQQQQQHNQRQVQVATAMALAQQQQQQQQQTQLNDVQIPVYGDFSNPVLLNSLQQQ